jgi:hypothetical protein
MLTPEATKGLALFSFGIQTRGDEGKKRLYSFPVPSYNIAV